MIFGAPAATGELLRQADVVTDFVLKFKEKLEPYFKPNGKNDSTTASDLKDFMGTIAAMVNDPDGTSSINLLILKMEENKLQPHLDLIQTRHVKRAVI